MPAFLTVLHKAGYLKLFTFELAKLGLDIKVCREQGTPRLKQQPVNIAHCKKNTSKHLNTCPQVNSLALPQFTPMRKYAPMGKMAVSFSVCVCQKQPHPLLPVLETPLWCPYWTKRVALRLFVLTHFTKVCLCPASSRVCMPNGPQLVQSSPSPSKPTQETQNKLIHSRGNEYWGLCAYLCYCRRLGSWVLRRW